MGEGAAGDITNIFEYHYSELVASSAAGMTVSRLCRRAQLVAVRRIRGASSTEHVALHRPSAYQSKLSRRQSWLTLKNAVPVRLNALGQNDENNCLACVALLAHLAQSQ